jgi:hypothetical protein
MIPQTVSSSHSAQKNSSNSPMKAPS